jgi:hypothetical protein
MLIPRRNLAVVFNCVGWDIERLPNGVVNVIVRCPNGHIGVLDHEIADDGTVTPSVQCPRCSWHESVKLDGWTKRNR